MIYFCESIQRHFDPILNISIHDETVLIYYFDWLIPNHQFESGFYLGLKYFIVSIL